MDPYLRSILRFPEQLTRRGLLPERLSLLARGKYDTIVFIGMGGSALAAGLVKVARMRGSWVVVRSNSMGIIMPPV